MNIINIDENTFNEILSRFQNFKERVTILCNKHKSKGMDDWLDNQDVCLLLNISPRTLQSYRDMGKIGFSQINYKIYYKASDIEKFLKPTNKNNSNNNIKPNLKQ